MIFLEKIINYLSNSTSRAEFKRKVNADNDVSDASDRDLDRIYDMAKGERKDTETEYAASVNNANKTRETGTSFAKTLSDLTQSMVGKNNFRSGEYVSMDDIINLGTNQEGNFTLNVNELFENVKNAFQEQVVTQLDMYYSLLRQINQETSLTGELSEQWREEIMAAYPALIRMGISFGELNDAMSQLVTEAGRFKLVDQETIEQLGLQGQVFFKSISDAVGSLEEFQKVSMGVEDAMETIEDIGLKSIQVGLNAKNTTDVLVRNLEKLNMYGFENGVEGLGAMVRQAQELRMDMNATFQLAEKVMDPTDALSLASNLQVIGGALGDFQDPLKMMWMATNDVKGLQDALVETVETLASYDVEEGAFRVMGADLRRARALADELGMNLQDVSNMAVQAAQRTKAMSDVMASGLNVDDQTMEFLTNLAQMKDGRMVIEIPENLREQFEATEIDLGNMSREQLNALKAFQEDFEKIETSEDIVRKQVGLVENIERDVSFMAARARLEAQDLVQVVADELGYSEEELQQFTKDLANKAAEGLGLLSGKVKGAMTNERMEREIVNQQQPQTQQTGNQNNQVVEKNIKHEYSFKVNSASFDKFSRFFMNDYLTGEIPFRHFLSTSMKEDN